MNFLVYKTVNNVNGKIYIGCHKTSNINDGYLGSGRLLLRAFEKYGTENFNREILAECSSEDEMFAKEAELVTAEFIARSDTYNLKVGGEGGWSFVNSSGKSVRHFSKQNAKEYSVKANTAKASLMQTDPEWALNYRNNISRQVRKYYANNPGPMSDKNHSEITRAQMRVSHIGKHVGEKNSQYGTMWITNGSVNQKIKHDTVIPDGWYQGRTIIRNKVP